MSLNKSFSCQWWKDSKSEGLVGNGYVGEKSNKRRCFSGVTDSHSYAKEVASRQTRGYLGRGETGKGKEALLVWSISEGGLVVRERRPERCEWLLASAASKQQQLPMTIRKDCSRRRLALSRAESRRSCVDLLPTATTVLVTETDSKTGCRLQLLSCSTDLPSIAPLNALANTHRCFC